MTGITSSGPCKSNFGFTAKKKSPREHVAMAGQESSPSRTRGGCQGSQYSWFLIKRISEAAAPVTPPAYLPRAASLQACGGQNGIGDRLLTQYCSILREFIGWHGLVWMHLKATSIPNKCSWNVRRNTKIYLALLLLVFEDLGRVFTLVNNKMCKRTLSSKHSWQK